MKEEFQKLMNILKQHEQGKPVNLDELLKASASFFKDLKSSFISGNPDEKKEVLKMVTDMYASMAAHAKQLSKTTGMSQDDITDYVQNPDNFTSEQWKMMQETREKITSSSKEIANYLQSLATEAAAEAPKEHEKKVEKKKPAARPKKDKWMKT